MRPRSSVVASVLFAALLAAVLPVAAQTTLFSDDFGPKPLASWQPSPLGLSNNWSASSGAAVYNGGGHTQLYAGNPAWSDYRIEAKVLVDNPSDFPGGIRGRVNTTTGQSYAAWIYPGTSRVRLIRSAAWHIDDPGFAILSEATGVSIAAGVTHTLALDFQGSQISVILNGTTVIQVTDSTLSSGAVALDVSNQPISFDDVLVTSGATTLFSDDFSPRPLRNWAASPLVGGNWDASSGAAAYDGGGHTQLYAGDPGWTDYTVEAKVRVTNASDYPGGIRGRLDTSTGGSYAAWIYPGSGKVKLWRNSVWHVDTPPTTMLAETNVSIATGTFHTLAIQFEGSRIQVSFNGTVVIDLTDATYSSGAVALDVSNQPIEYDDVTVIEPAAPPPATQLFADDFASNSLSNWTPSPLGLFSNWTAASGFASYNGGGHTQIYAGSGTWTDYTLETKFRLAIDQNHPGGIRGRVNTTTGESYAAWIYPSDGVIKLIRAAAWDIDTAGLALLASANVGAITVNVFHTLELTFSGSQITVTYDGTEVISITDTAIAAGAVALDVSNKVIDFDDVVVASPTPPPPATLFEDDFDDLSGWTASPLGLFSNWSAASGTASYNGGGHTQIYAGSALWTDYEFEAKFRLANGSNHPGGIRGRVNTTTGESYAAWIYPADGVIKLIRSADWHIDTAGFAILAQVNVGTIAPSVWHTLTLTFEGNRIQVSLNGTTVIDLTDTVLAAGAIALDVSNQPIEFDDVVVTEIGGGGPPPGGDTDNGPGGPVLVISKSGNPFTRYYGEILLAEGLNHYAIREIGTVTATILDDYDVAILGEMTLTSGEVTMLTDWVNAGGNLITMRPDPQLASLLGLTAASGTLAEGYLLASDQGIVNQTIQFHGTADHYALNGATAVATLYSNATTATAHPAVTLRSVGSSGGQAAAFTYDLARSIVYTRQGNPAWAGQERDGNTPLRSSDLFFPDWINLDKVAIPQADEQQRLLANLILNMNADRKPLPRFWYFPRGEKAVVLMTGDDHGNNGTEGRFQSYQLDSPVGCSVADWECVRGTSYIFPNTPIAPATAEAFEADGFEIAVHVNTNCANWSPSSLQTVYATQIASFASIFTTLDVPVTNRTHCIVWSDWVSQAKVSKDNGIRLDTNYYYWPPEWILDRPGFMTGSGMPMRFADVDGTRIDVYQAATQFTDESGQSYPLHPDTLLDNALGSAGYYGVMTANMHTDSTTSSGSDAIVASAQTRGVPVVTARQMLTWLDGRNGSSFGSIAWSGNTLTFTVTAASGSNGLRGMIPASTSAGTLASLTVGGNPVTWTTETIKGISYAIFPASSGSYTATYAP
ncbi:MAG TPA: family 16 glycoside hydrolase [Thermoanaerobaculia bacterium]|nr:family 16 glycoside hydrolase [Thermoanaerobaculia bacterium]